VAQCFVYGDSLKPAVVAVVVPDEEVLKKWAKEAKIEGDFKTLCARSDVKKKILEDMVSTGKTGKLQGFEIVKEITLETQLWSIENGILVRK
jgi:long-chain acyl-CoA synthetase